MKKGVILFCILSFYVFFAINVSAQDEKIGAVQEIPEGMEAIAVGQATMIVPKGTTMHEVAGGFLTRESIDEYVSRKFVAMDERFGKIEAEEKARKEKIEAIEAQAKEMSTKQIQIEETLADIEEDAKGVKAGKEEKLQGLEDDVKRLKEQENNLTKKIRRLEEIQEETLKSILKDDQMISPAPEEKSRKRKKK